MLASQNLMALLHAFPTSASRTLTVPQAVPPSSLPLNTGQKMPAQSELHQESSWIYKHDVYAHVLVHPFMLRSSWIHPQPPASDNIPPAFWAWGD
ncbi:hypothetical protein AOLI_G00143110 [Acnodon oligacanthus]